MDRILVVDDEPLVRELAVIILEDLGYDVVDAANGEDAYRILCLDDSITAVVTDIVMPRLDGFGFAAKAWHLKPGLRILFTSGNHLGTPAVRAPNRSTPPVLAKPYRPNQLGAAVRELLAV